MRWPRSTKLHINAVIALGVLLIMFSAVAALAHAALVHTNGIVDRDLVALMAIAIAGVVYTVKTFAGVGDEDGRADENGHSKEPSKS